MQAADVYGQTLHQKGSSPANRISPMRGEFFQEFLVAEDGRGRLRGFEYLKEGELFFGSQTLQNSWPERRPHQHRDVA
jgi:hypothetical protein